MKTRLLRQVWAMAIGTALFAAGTLMADSPLRPPKKYAKCSPKESYCLRADPATGIAVIKVSKKKIDLDATPLWSISKWGRVVYLSDDGQHLAMGLERRSIIDKYDPGTVVVTFFEHGREVRSVSLGELVPPADAKKLEPTVSGLVWGEYMGFHGKKGEFLLETSAGMVYAIDPSTGKVVESHPASWPPDLEHLCGSSCF